MIFTEVNTSTFIKAFNEARTESQQVAKATSKPEDLDAYNSRFYLSVDHKSGFAVTLEGNLNAVFSLVKGRGDSLVSHAINFGAYTLDCFDGYLPKFYSKHGFNEYRREANWTAGEPDVVFMTL